MPKRVGPHTRLFVLALIFNIAVWGFQQRQGWSIGILLPYLAGVMIGWLIHPFFIPRRDKWTKSPYDRLSVRLLRCITVGGMITFVSQLILKVATK